MKKPNYTSKLQFTEPPDIDPSTMADYLSQISKAFGLQMDQLILGTAESTTTSATREVHKLTVEAIRDAMKIFKPVDPAAWVISIHDAKWLWKNFKAHGHKVVRVKDRRWLILYAPSGAKIADIYVALDGMLKRGETIQLDTSTIEHLSMGIKWRGGYD